MPEFFAGHAMVSRLLRTFLVAMALSATWSRAVHADNVEERPTIVVALVASDPGDSATVLLDMLVAQFSIEPNVRMVERRQIAQVLSEQGLQLAVASPDECVRVGTLVGADLIGVLEMNSDGKQPIGLMLFETSSTRRVGDSTLRPSMEEACEDAADGLRTALRAMRDGAGVTLSVLAVRNADLPPAFTSLADGLVQLWERRLLGAGRITVLERARLEAMNRERDLVGARDANQLQHSVILAEAQLHRGHGPNQLALSIRLTDGKGKLLSNLTAQAQEEHAIELVDELVRQFDTWRDDGAASITQVNRKGEAGRFYVEGVRNLDGPYPERGLRAAEAAYALSATDHHRKLLATSLIWFVQRQLGADHKNPFVRNPTELTARQVADVLPLAQRSLDLTYLTLERARASNRNALSQHVYKDSFQWNHALEGFITAVNGSPQFPEIHQAITHFKQQLRRYHGALYERLDTLRQREADPWPGRWSALRLEAPKRLRASSTMEQYSEDQVQLWARSITPFTPEAAATLKPETLFHLHEALRWLHSPQPRDWSLGGGTAPVYWGEWTWAQRSTIMNPLWRQLEQHPWIMLQWHGRLARSADAVRQRGVSATDPPHKDERTPAGDAGKRQFTSLVSELRDWLTEPPPNENTSLIMGYLLWREAILLLLLQDSERVAAINSLVAHMLDRRVIIGGLLMDMMTNLDRSGPNKTPEAPMLIDRAVRMAAAGEARLLLQWDEHYRHAAEKFLADSPHRSSDSQTLVLKNAPKVVHPRDSTFNLNDVHRVGDDLILVGVTTDRSNREWICWRIAIQGANLGTAKALGRLPVTQPINRPLHFFGGPCAAAAIADNTLFLASYTEGLLAFPFDDRKAWKLTVNDGLPSQRVTALAAVGSVLYMGVGDGHGSLLSFDLQTRQFTTLASSERQNAGVPLDNMPEGFAVYALVPTPDGRSIVASVSVMRKGSVEVHPSSGLWRLDIHTGKLTQLLNARGGHNLTWVEKGRTIWGEGWWSSFTFDLNTGKARLCRASQNSDKWLNGRLGQGLARQPVNVVHTHHLRGSFLADDRHMFSAHPFGLFSLDSGRFFPLPWQAIRSNVIPRMQILSLGEERLLALWEGELWVLDWSMPPKAH